jgi:hypothetical protein
MNALSAVFDSKITASSPIGSTEDISFALLHRSLNKITDKVFEDDLYESAEEQRPQASALVSAALALSFLSLQDMDTVEIEPYSGELGLVWKSGRTKRVKAMFRAKDEYFSVYHEQMIGGRVSEHHLQPNADNDYLRNRLAWLRT